MKKFTLVAFLLVAFIAGTFANGNGKSSHSVDASKSEVKWVGEKVTGKHEGGISVKEGSLELKNGKLKGGSFIIDMTSITCTDLEGGTRDKLLGHLKSDDFFGVDNYKTSTLTITKVTDKGSNKFEVKANLTIKGQTHPVTFQTTLTENGAEVSADATIKVDRTKYGIKYGSGSFFDNLGDKAIDNEFTLTVKLVGKKNA